MNDTHRCEGLMPVISLASSKGGPGKSTTAVLLACELAGQGASVTVIDADPNKAIFNWSQKAAPPDGLTVLDSVSETNILDFIEEAATKTQFVIVDLEGTASMMVSLAISASDLVLIPCKGSQLDAEEAVKVIKLIKLQERSIRRSIPFSVLMTQTSPSIRSRTLTSIRNEFEENHIHLIPSELHERDAYKALFTYGGSLATLNPDEVGGLSKALINARAMSYDIVARLRGLQPNAESQVAHVEPA